MQSLNQARFFVLAIDLERLIIVLSFPNAGFDLSLARFSLIRS
jgi:hypothetical protein